MKSDPLIRFRQLFKDAPEPVRADAGLSGTATLRAFRFCEPFTAASALGWYVFPPIDFSLLWDGDRVYWKQATADPWVELDAVLLPGFASEYAAAAPDSLVSIGATPFLGRGPEPGIVQLWAGLVVETRPDWCTLVRPLANHPRDSRYEFLDGLMETDWWSGPLVTPMRLRKTDEPIRFRKREPVYQIQLVPRVAFEADVMESFVVDVGLDRMNDEAWEALESAIRLRKDSGDQIGSYKREVRKRARARRGDGD